MTRDETVKCITIASASYKNFVEESLIDTTINLWTQLFADYSYTQVSTALFNHITTSRFAPTIADILEKLQSVKGNDYMTADEAWGTFTKAVSKYGYYRKKEALNSLDEVTRSIVESMGFEYLCHSTDIMADRAHFLKAYAAKVERAKIEQKKPTFIKQREALIQGQRVAIE